MQVRCGGNGSGGDWLDGGDGSDTLYGDTDQGDGSGNDMLIGRDGDDKMYGDTAVGLATGIDVFYGGPGNDTAVGEVQTGDTLIEADEWAPTFTYQVNGYQAQYREDPDTGAVMVYNNEFGTWDTLGERYWDAERNAWVTNMGATILAEYADRTVRYDNYSTDMWILENDSWQPYNPDEHYIVDYREDPETGKLLVYNNDLGTWDPYMEEYQPVGESYTVLNEGNLISVEYDDGTLLRLENYGDDAALNGPATGYHWMDLPSSLVYRDTSTNLWYSYGWGSWHYSIDVGATWQEVPMLDFRIVDNADGSVGGALAAAADDSGSVNVFDGGAWYAQAGKLEFFDSRYAPSGWHEITGFYVELYDGIGYDGQPLLVMDAWQAADGSGLTDGALTGLFEVVPVGTMTSPAEDAEITYWHTWIYGAWTSQLLFSYEIPNPSPDYRPERIDSPLSVYFEANDTLNRDNPRAMAESLGPNVLYHLYNAKAYSLRELSDHLEMIQYVASKGSTRTDYVEIETLMILNHGDAPGIFRVGVDTVKPGSFYEHGYDKSFASMNAVLSDNAQIHHYGCLQAGLNPYDPIIMKHDGDGSEYDRFKEGTLPYVAAEGRRMYPTIAQLTGATVFASSDMNGAIYNDKEHHFQAWEAEMCLEFGVGPDGFQVDAVDDFRNYSTSGFTLWNRQEKWENIESMQQPDATVPYPFEKTYLPEKYYLVYVDTYAERFEEGEERPKYLPLGWGFGW